MRWQLISALLGATFLSFGTWQPPPPRVAQPTEPVMAPDAVSSPDPAAVPEGLPEMTFTLVAVNISEKVIVHCPAPSFDPDDASSAAAQHLMRAIFPDKEGKIDRKLLLALRDIAHATTGTVEIISAYRRPSWRGDHNYHVRGQAADIRVPGVPTWKLRDLSKKLGLKGVGYYPTTKMVHIDTRDTEWFWTDWSGPG